MDSCAKALYDRLKAKGRKILPSNAEAWVKAVWDENTLMKPMTYDEILNKAELLAENAMRNAYVKKRNTALLLRAENNISNYVVNNFKGKQVVEGIKSAIAGTQQRVSGGRISADVQQRHYVNKHRNSLALDLTRKGVFKDYISGELDDDIAVELYLLNKGTDAQPTGNKVARDIAESIARVQENARKIANKYGADIQKLDGYISSQTHDMFKLRAMGRDAWKALVAKNIDVKRSFDIDPSDTKKLNSILNDIYSHLSSGKQYKVEVSEPVLAAKKPTYSIASGKSQARVLHFKTPQGWLEYNKSAGVGNLRETVDGTLSSLGEAAGLMEVLGPNPKELIKRVINRVGKNLEDDARNKLAGSEKGIENILSAVDGSDRIPGNAVAARALSTYRGIQNLSKLGGMVVSQIVDIPTVASELKYQGFGFAHRWAEALNVSARGLSKAERKELGYMLNLYTEGQIYDMTNRFTGADMVPGAMAKAQALFFKYNLSTPFTNRTRHNAAFAMSGNLAMQAKKPWKSLHKSLRATMEQFGITEADWPKIADGLYEVGGNKFITVEGLEEAGHGALAKKISAYYIDRSETAVLNPDARVQAKMRHGTQPGTVPGEFLRLIGQFKAFPMAFMQKVIARDLLSNGEKTFMEAIRNGSGLFALAETVATATMFGYMAYTAKGLLKGELPAQPETPAQFGKIMAASMMQGGGLGLMGDFFLGAQNRFGTESNMVSLLGPTASNAEELTDLLAMGLDVTGTQQEDMGGQLMKIIQSNTPGANLFYLRPALNYLVFWRLQEMSSPGYLQRMEARSEEERGAQFWYRPSELIE